MAFVQSIMPVSQGDNVRIAINLFNLKGLVDLKFIKWHSVILEEIPSIPKIIDENNISQIPPDRMCELETLLHDWVPYDYHPDSKSLGPLDCFSPLMILKEARYCGVGMLALRIIYQLNQTGHLTNGIKELGVNLIVRGKKEEVTVEIKRKGLAYDLENQLEMKIGDILTFYLSRPV